MTHKEPGFPGFFMNNQNNTLQLITIICNMYYMGSAVLSNKGRSARWEKWNVQ